MPKEKFSLSFVCGSKVITFTDQNYTADNHLIYEEIKARKINGSIVEKKREVLRLLENGVSEKDAVLNCFPALEKTFNRISQYVFKKPIDSKIRFDPDKSTMFTLTKEKYGVQADESAFYADVVYALFTNKTKIKIKTAPITEVVTVKDNEKFLYRKASYSTSLATSSKNRKHNVEKALLAINGTVLQKDEILSFNQKTGVRSEENGYKNAKIIMGNEYVDGVGGGVCQSSTTLYNCALLAGVEVVEVSSHSLIPSYVEPSFDAMVNIGSSDLKLKNNTDGPLFIKAFVNNDRATVVIYGQKNEYEIRKKSVTVSKGEMPKDKKVYDSEGKYFDSCDRELTKRISYSQPSIVSEGYLVYYKDGEKQKEIKIRQDRYNSKSGIIAYRVEKDVDALFLN